MNTNASPTRAEIKNLHFHDLRREFASRLRETPGISDHHVRDWLGHADLATTSRYLATTRVGLQQARRVFEQHRDSSRRTSLLKSLRSAKTGLADAVLAALPIEALEALAAAFAHHSHKTPAEAAARAAETHA